jgi:hypothetical protein
MGLELAGITTFMIYIDMKVYRVKDHHACLEA